MKLSRALQVSVLMLMLAGCGDPVVSSCLLTNPITLAQLQEPLREVSTVAEAEDECGYPREEDDDVPRMGGIVSLSSAAVAGARDFKVWMNKAELEPTVVGDELLRREGPIYRGDSVLADPSRRAALVKRIARERSSVFALHAQLLAVGEAGLEYCEIVRRLGPDKKSVSPLKFLSLRKKLFDKNTAFYESLMKTDLAAVKLSCDGVASQSASAAAATKNLADDKRATPRKKKPVLPPGEKSAPGPREDRAAGEGR